MPTRGGAAAGRARRRLPDPGPGAAPDAWAAWALPSESVLERHLPAAPRGDLLYVGPLTEDRARWLLRNGFAVEVVVPSASGVVEWPPPPAGVGAVLRLDPTAPALPAMRYAFAVLDGAPNLLPPRSGARLIAAVRGAVKPGGVVYAAAYTAADADGATHVPGGGGAGQPDARDQPPRAWLLARGELAMAFEDWLLLHLVEGQVRDGAGRERSATVLVARRPSGGTLLA